MLYKRGLILLHFTLICICRISVLVLSERRWVYVGLLFHGFAKLFRLRAFVRLTPSLGFAWGAAAVGPLGTRRSPRLDFPSLLWGLDIGDCGSSVACIWSLGVGFVLFQSFLRGLVVLACPKKHSNILVPLNPVLVCLRGYRLIESYGSLRAVFMIWIGSRFPTVGVALCLLI